MSFLGRAILLAVRSVGAVAVNAAMTELKKPETQAKIGAGIATVHQHLNDPEMTAQDVCDVRIRRRQCDQNPEQLRKRGAAPAFCSGHS